MSELERTVVVVPAWDCIGVRPCVHGSAKCKPGSGGNHGRHNAEIRFTVLGPEAEIALVVNTGWDLPTVPQHQRISQVMKGDFPSGQRVELHTARSKHSGQDRSDPAPEGSCKDWDGCYFDAGYTMADEPARLLVEKGSEAVWEWLEALHDSTVDDMDKVTPVE